MATLIVLVVFVALTIPTEWNMSAFWSPSAESVLSHGWLVVAAFIVGYFRESTNNEQSVRVLRSRPSLLALLCVVSFGWAWARSTGIGLVEYLAWFCFLVVTLASIFGLRTVIDSLSRPLIVLFTALPLWELFLPFLWTTTTAAVKLILGLLGVPAYFENNRIHLPAGTLEIVAGCAGLAFFAAAMSFAAIIGWLNRVKWSRYPLLFAAAAGMAMISNWIRISIIAFEAARTNMQTPLVTVGHYYFGWVVFAIGLLAYIVVFSNYGRSTGDNPYARAVPARVEVGFARIAIVVAVAAIGPSLLLLSGIRSQVDHGQAGMSLEPATSRAVQADVSSSSWHPYFAGADLQVFYGFERSSANLYANVYWYQQQGHELIGGDNTLLPGNTWRVVRISSTDQYSEAIVAHNDSQAVLRHVFVCGHDTLTSPIRLQLVCGLKQLFQPVRLGIVALFVPCRFTCADMNDTVESIWSTEAASLVAQFGSAQ